MAFGFRARNAYPEVMTQPAPPEILVDARGHRCPVPTLRLRRAVESAAPGAMLCLLADDPMAKIDVPHYAGQAGLELVGVSEDGAGFRFQLRKP